ncbi:MAG: NHL domain-containing protein [Myxococcales bacterium]
MTRNVVLLTFCVWLGCSSGRLTADAGGSDGGEDAGVNCADAGDAGWSVTELLTRDAGCGDFPDLALAPNGSLVATEPCGQRVLSIDQNGDATVLAGNGRWGDVDGPATAAEFNTPTGVAVDDAGRIYVADLCNDAIRKIDVDGTVSTIVYGLTGVDCSSHYIDKLSVALDGRGGIYVGRGYGNGIYAGSLDGGFSLLVNGSGGGADGGPELDGVWGLAADALGDVYVASRTTVWRVAPQGGISLLAGGGQGVYPVDGQGQSAVFGWLAAGISLGPSGDLYVDDEGIRRVTSNGMVTTLARPSGCLQFPLGLSLAVSSADIFLDYSSRFYRLHLLEGSL